MPSEVRGDLNSVYGLCATAMLPSSLTHAGGVLRFQMHDLFLRYKDLKKKIKAIPVNKGEPPGYCASGRPIRGAAWARVLDVCRLAHDSCTHAWALVNRMANLNGLPGCDRGVFS